MKQLFAFILCVTAFCVTAAPLAIPMPFKKCTKSSVDGWQGQ